MLWNAFYADARDPINARGFQEVIFADDLNGFREYPPSVQDNVILEDLEKCQQELHLWGKANQVEFDPSKESFHILSRVRPHGDSFKMLGVEFDCKLTMTDTVLKLAKDARWKMKAVLRTKKYITGIQLTDVYKSQILSFVEYRTPAIYHACDSSLQTLDSIQDALLAAAGMNELEALYVANLAPLCVRRDIGLLGVIHRTVLGRGPSHFAKFIVKNEASSQRQKHRMQLNEYRNGDVSDFALPGSRPAEYIQRSLFGLLSIYNMLPADIVEQSSTVSSFQSRLQKLVKERALNSTDWKYTFSPRIPLHRHPLINLV